MVFAVTVEVETDQAPADGAAYARELEGERETVGNKRREEYLVEGSGGQNQGDMHGEKVRFEERVEEAESVQDVDVSVR